MADDPNSPRVLVVVRNDMEAALLVGCLAEQGIDAHAGGAGTSTGWPEALGDVRVVVRLCDLERARAALEELPRLTSGARGV